MRIIMNYWIVVTSPENFKHDREHLQFQLQGLPHRFRKQVQKMNFKRRNEFKAMIGALDEMFDELEKTNED